MAAQNPHRTAVLLIDVINHFEFEDGRRLLRQCLPIVPNLVRLKAEARRAGLPVIYVNDNFGEWHSNAQWLVGYCLRSECPGRDFVDKIRPDAEDYCILKPMHSGFYQTPLDVLLRHLSVTSLILAGIATNSCILCTAHDARMRDLNVSVATDCCAARSPREHREALAHIAAMANGHLITSRSLRRTNGERNATRSRRKALTS